MQKKRSAVVQHLSTTKVFQAAAGRFMEMRRRHSIACDLMWAGTLASHFTKAEIALLGDYLSPHDRALLASTSRARN